MDQSFKPLHVSSEGVGLKFRSSKKHFIWKFELDLEEHTVELECSFLTNKRRVTFDRTLLFTGMKPIGGVFQYRFFHNKHVITIDNPRTDADLLVDSLSFNFLYQQRIWNRSYPNPGFKKENSQGEYPKETFGKPVEDSKAQNSQVSDVVEGKNVKKELGSDFLELDANDLSNNFFTAGNGISVNSKQNLQENTEKRSTGDNKLTALFENKAKTSNFEISDKLPSHTPVFANKSLAMKLPQNGSRGPNSQSPPPITHKYSQSQDLLTDFGFSSQIQSSPHQQLIETPHPLENVFSTSQQDSSINPSLMGVNLNPQMDIFSSPQTFDSMNHSHPNDWLNIDMQTHIRNEEKSVFEDIFS
ncbi:unnamed protein product [Blepharisma stoltei]|uniref:Uncharacterized protein n=1 Tax=Blepharisma stoltei TaxID=1481888 RepID=A0AAU9IF71_9CILI|nr:unnamed protein product [Blepharisma stoltei]